jgi:hypothetical protein
MTMLNETRMMVDNLHEQTREKNYCEKHNLIHVKNAVGQFVCPFCEADVYSDNDRD